MNKKTLKKAGTFSLNHSEAIHSWYPYMEGYSSCLIEEQIRLLEGEAISNIYDPFGGTGTTPLVASQLGLQSFYSETNPFMQEVIECKINCVKSLIDSGTRTRFLKAFQKSISSPPLSQFPPEWQGFEKYYDSAALSDILYLKEQIRFVKDNDSRRILMLALSSIAVLSSKMIRRGDLRYALPNEKSANTFDIFNQFLIKLSTVIADIENIGEKIKLKTTLLSADARDIILEDQIDCVITSPPYLNGTNYIRNTKLELKLNDFVISEDDLPMLHSKGIIAGINNVSKRNGNIRILPVIQPFIEQLTHVAYDSRITSMVAGYFDDMSVVIEKLSIAMRNKGIFIMDIGDSQFAGIHIPTHDILSEICVSFGFEKIDETILRERRSKNGMVLSQRLLKFRLNKTTSAEDVFKSQAKTFIETLPYKKGEFSSRSWGHAWHSLCSYHGKLKPALAHFLVSSFTRKGETVLDPLCGVGTIPFEACLQGRIGIGNDLSELAFVVSKAKLEKPLLNDVLAALGDLECYINANSNNSEISLACDENSQFGFNGKLPVYFHQDTYREIICARQFFLSKKMNLSSSETMVFSCFLHVLHGNRPYALSRTSHPLTPYAPKGEFVYKNVISHIKEKITLSFKQNDFSEYVSGSCYFGDYSNIPLTESVDCIITSPPFADSIRFYMQNWMRLWLCGWSPAIFKQADSIFLDTKQKKDFSIYKSFFEMCFRILKPQGKIILHLGKTAKVDMAEELSTYASPLFTEIYRGDEDVTQIEKHGIKDKGATVNHQFLFLLKN